jgi:hypothetical protein
LRFSPKHVHCTPGYWHIVSSVVHLRDCVVAVSSSLGFTRLSYLIFAKFVRVTSSRMWARRTTHSVKNPLRTIYEHAKTLLFVYVLLTNAGKIKRHLRARGIASTLQDFWKWIAEVKSCLVMQLLCMRTLSDASIRL